MDTCRVGDPPLLSCLANWPWPFFRCLPPAATPDPEVLEAFFFIRVFPLFAPPLLFPKVTERWLALLLRRPRELAVLGLDRLGELMELITCLPPCVCVLPLWLLSAAPSCEGYCPAPK